MLPSNASLRERVIAALLEAHGDDNEPVAWSCHFWTREQAAEFLADAAIAEMPTWQPIETAPKEKPVLTFRRAKLMAVAEYDVEHEQWLCIDGAFLVNVTHWMPLPEPPDE